MARQMGCALVIVLSLASAGAVRAQSEAQPPASDKKQESTRSSQNRRPWWKDEKFRAEVGFNAEQGAEIEKIHKAYLETAMPLRAEVNELDKAIEKMIVARDTDLAIFNHTVEKVEARRAELNKARTVMLYKIRRVFTPEQNVRFQAAVDRWEASRRKQDGDRRR